MKAIEFRITFSVDLSVKPLDGQVLLLVSTNDTEESRFQISNYPESKLIFGIDVNDLKLGEEAVIDGDVLGYPIYNITQIPAGEYWAHVILHKYETFNRSIGHTVKLHMDQGTIGEHVPR